MGSILDHAWHAFSYVSAVLPTAGHEPAQRVAEVVPVLLALLTVMLAVTLCTHWRHAIGSIAIPPDVPVLPGGLPLIGHCIPVLRNLHRMHDWLYDATQAMGEGRSFAFSVPLLPTSLVVTDPVCLEHILKHRTDNYIKGRLFKLNYGPLLGHGIFVSDGEDWYWQRKLATNIFSVKSFKQYIDTVFDQKMVVLSKVVGAAAASGSPLDLHDLLYRFTLDSFGQIGFGVDPGCLRASGKVPFAAAFDSAQAIVINRFWMPGWQLVERLSGSRALLSRDVAVIRAFAADIITSRHKQLAAGAAAAGGAGGRDQGLAVAGGRGSEDDAPGGPTAADGAGVCERPRDLLSLFMESKGPDGAPLDTQQLTDTVINFIIAGRDTTAQALSWTFYLLLQHPEVEQRLLQEIQEVLGVTPGGAAAGGHMLRPSYDQLRALRYARAVFLEALRLYPSVPEDAKYAVARDVLPDGTVVAPGTQVIYSAWLVNRMKAYWGPDAPAFRPDRWLQLDKTPSPYNYLSFNAGPRICLGQRLAELEGVFVLTGLLARFRFKQVVPGAVVNYTLSPTMPMKEGLMLLAEPRT